MGFFGELSDQYVNVQALLYVIVIRILLAGYGGFWGHLNIYKGSESALTRSVSGAENQLWKHFGGEGG